MILDKKIPISYILGTIKIDLLVVLVIGLLTYFFTAGFNPFLPEMPLSIPAFLGTAISILLSFKMNQSYDRWWEARKVWGAIVNDSRSLVVQLQSFLSHQDAEAIRKISYRQIAWCYALGNALRGKNPAEELHSLVTQADLDEIAKHANKPLALAQLSALEIKELRLQQKLDIFAHLQLNDTITRLIDSMGKAERINGTVFPSTYRMFLHFLILLFVVTLSISLKEVSMVFEVPLLLLISSGFFLIEKSAYHLQDPFRNRPSDVSVTAIARTIEINIRQLLGEQDIPKPVQPNEFYIL